MSSIHNENDTLMCTSIFQWIKIVPFILATVVPLVDDFICVVDDGFFVFIFIFVFVLVFVFIRVRVFGLPLNFLLFCRCCRSGGDGSDYRRGRSRGVSEREEKDA